MAFIKVGKVVINTNYIALVKLENPPCSGETGVSLLIATPQLPLLPRESTSQGGCCYKWLDFTGSEARALQDFFSSFNNVIDLQPYGCAGAAQ